MPDNPLHPELAVLSTLADTASDSQSSFVKYRSLLFPYRVALSAGMTDSEYVTLVTTLDASIKSLDGAGFHSTPLTYDKSLNALVKNETGSVAQSHKARHLFNLMTYLLVLQRTDPAQSTMKQTRRLAVASCGNAGLAAATIAAAAAWPIDVCIPTDADAAVVAKLQSLGSTVNIVPCAREVATVETPFGRVAADTEADPTVAVFKNLVKNHNSIPFSVQGSECGMAVEGMHTLAWEILEQAKELGFEGEFAELFIQIGGGALGAGLNQGMERSANGDVAVALGAAGGGEVGLEKAPRLVCVQAEGNAPLNRAYRRMEEMDLKAEDAAKSRKDFMYPWSNPSSVASGILDDETYDWVELTRGMQRSGGKTLVVTDDSIRAANSYIKETHGVNACHTGSVGMAGLMTARKGGGEGGAPASVVFSGVDRG